MNETMSSRINYPDDLAGDLAGVRKTAATEAKTTAKVAKTNNDDWKDFDFNAVNLEKPRPTRTVPRSEMVRLAITGLLGGALVWLVRLALEAWLMRPLFCRTPDTATVCVSAGATSLVLALIIVGGIAAAVLTKARVFRATLVSLATFVALAALWPLLDGRNWLVATLLSALFAALLYLFFALVAAIKKYVLAVVLLAVLVMAFWLLARM